MSTKKFRALQRAQGARKDAVLEALKSGNGRAVARQFTRAHEVAVQALGLDTFDVEAEVEREVKKSSAKLEDAKLVLSALDCAKPGFDRAQRLCTDRVQKAEDSLSEAGDRVSDKLARMVDQARAYARDEIVLSTAETAVGIVAPAQTAPKGGRRKAKSA